MRGKQPGHRASANVLHLTLRCVQASLIETLLLCRPTEEITDRFEDLSRRLDLRVKSASGDGAGTEGASRSEARAELLMSVGVCGIAAELRTVTCSRGGGVQDLLRGRRGERPLSWEGESWIPPVRLSMDTSNEPGIIGGRAVF